MSERSLAIRQEIGTLQLADLMVKSGFFADTRSQAQAVVKMLAGAELDFGPIASMTGFHIIEGRPSMAAPLVGAAIKRSGRYDYRVVDQTDSSCTIDFFEVVGGKREKLGSSKFDLDDAARAGLTSKKGDMWGKYPRNMCWSRALTNGARWFTPDIFNGAVYTPEELGAEVDSEGNVVETLDVAIEASGGPKFVPIDVREVSDADLVRSADDPLWKRWMQLAADASRWRVGVPREVRLGMPRQQLIEHGVELSRLIEERKELLAREDAERAAGAAERQTPGALPVDISTRAEVVPQASLWQRNRALHAEAYALGLRLRELPVSATEEEIAAQNGVLEDWITNRPQDDRL